MKHTNCYIYPKTVREAIEGKRHYDTGKEKLPSVTTILSSTQDPEKAQSLKAWRDRVGEASATRIVDEAAARGTAMHKILERYRRRRLFRSYSSRTQCSQHGNQSYRARTM